MKKNFKIGQYLRILKDEPPFTKGQIAKVVNLDPCPNTGEQLVRVRIESWVKVKSVKRNA